MTSITTTAHDTTTRTTAIGSSRTTPRALRAALRSEWVKASSLRSTTAIAALTVAVGGFASWAVGTLITDQVLTVAEVFTFSTVFTAVFAAVAGILQLTTETQHGTLAQAVTAQPRRWIIATAKSIVAVAFAATLSALGLLAGFAGSVLSGIDMGDTSTMLNTSLWATGFTAMAGLLGLGVGMIARHSAAALSGLLIWWLVVESLVTVFIDERYSRFLPFLAGNRMLGFNDDDATAALLFTKTENALIFGSYAALAFAAGTILLHRLEAK